MVSINGVTVAYGGWELFKDISFVINDNERIGLVGKNGAGKSTLMKIIIKEINPTSGSVTIDSDIVVGYLPQQMKIKDEVTVFEETKKAFNDLLSLEQEVKKVTKELENRDDYSSDSYIKLIEHFNHINDRYNILVSDNIDGKIERALIGLGFRREDFHRKTAEFSGGWRMRIELAKILLCNPSVLLLDEPTNHLDIESIRWLENYLCEYKGAVVLISHDRKFLDTVTTRTIEIVLGKVNDYRVEYSKYVMLRKERLQQQQATYENQQKMIKDTEEFIERFRYKPSKSNQVQSRVKQLDKLDILEVEQEDLSSLNIKFPAAPRSGDIVLETKSLSKSFGSKEIFSGCDIIVQRGEKIALVGRNGEGKTTFARMIVGDTEITSGEIKIGHNVSVGYYAQNQDDIMDGDFTVLDTLDRVAVGDVRTRLRDILGAFLFRGEDVDKKVRILSGGERSRLAMARLMLKPYNLLILDEPTNHMDMRSKDILKNALQNFDGTLILVSHDREFLDGLAEKVYEFRDGGVKEHLGGIYDFLRKRDIEILDMLNLKEKENSTNTQKDSDNKLSYIQKKEKEKRLRKIKNDISQIESEIESVESEIESMNAKISNPSQYGIDLSDHTYFDKFTSLKKNLSDLMDRWSEATIELEEQENII